MIKQVKQMPISIDQFAAGSEVASKKLLDVMDPNSAYTAKEIADLLGISPASARQRLTRAYEKGLVTKKRLDGKVYWARKTQ
jgi:predicted ArsR family transcriptional regulator